MTGAIHEEAIHAAFREAEREDAFRKKRLLRQYPDQWVAIRDGEVIATSSDLLGIVKELEQLGLKPTQAWLQYSQCPSAADDPVIRGWFDSIGAWPAPRVRATVSLHGLSGASVATTSISFLIDTGSGISAIHPGDAIGQVGIPAAGLMDLSNLRRSRR